MSEIDRTAAASAEPNEADEFDDAAAQVDGRVARRERNVDAVLDVVLDLFGEESLFPTIEQAATGSGLSLRSLYRYFADPGELLEATIVRSRERGVELARLKSIGEGPLDARIDDFVTTRLRLYETLGPAYRATVANAARLPRISNELAKTRDDFRRQFSLQFAPELQLHKPAERDVMLNGGDVITQLDSIDYLRRVSGLSVAKTVAVLTSTLHAILDG